MLRLKTILRSSNVLFILLLIVILFSYIYASFPLKSAYNPDDITFTGKLISYSIDGDKFSFIIKGKEYLKGTYYINSQEEKEKLSQLDLGIILYLTGELSLPKKNTIPNTFNYEKYLKSQRIKYILKVNTLNIKSYKTSFIYYLKNKLIKYIKTYKSSNYLLTLVLGIKDDLDEETYHKYQSLGISHIFSISGMHISLLSGIILYLLKGLKDNQRYLFAIIFLFLYLLLIGPIPGVLRSTLLFIYLYLNKKYDFNLETLQIFYLTIITMLIYNPYYIYNLGFLYSSIISYALIRYSKIIKGNYLISILKVSLLALLICLPITINNNYEFNILSIIYNLFYVPFISFIIYPLSLISLFIKPIDNLLIILINVLEYITNIIPTINIIIPKIPILLIIIYYIILYIFLNTYQKKYLLFIIIILLTLKYSHILNNSYKVFFLDVGQGDSSLILHKNQAIIIDTGGKQEYVKEEWQTKTKYYLTDNTITLLHSLGYSHINYLILTHGDYDHMGEAIHLINSIKVKKVIFNCGIYNDLEKELINVLENKKINYYSCINKLDNLSFLQTKEYDNENDNSNVIYTKLNGYSFMFMGDASITTEKEILDKYNLTDIDVLKVGHHGSNTSSGKEFINIIKPKYSIISVGKNNRYGHPNKEVLENLNNSKVFRTDQDGSIMFTINNNKIKHNSS